MQGIGLATKGKVHKITVSRTYSEYTKIDVKNAENKIDIKNAENNIDIKQEEETVDLKVVDNKISMSTEEIQLNVEVD